MNLIDQMQKMVESLNVEELEISYETEDNGTDYAVVAFTPDSEDMIRVANLLEIQLDAFYKIKSMGDNSKKTAIRFEKKFSNYYFENLLKNAMLMILDSKGIQQYEIEVTGYNADTTCWDWVDKELLEGDLAYFKRTINQLECDFDIRRTGIYKYVISYLRRDKERLEDIFEKVDRAFEHCGLIYKEIVNLS